MTEKEFNQFLGAIAARTYEGEEFKHIINQMIALLEEGDFEDFYGTEGWRHNLGWD